MEIISFIQENPQISVVMLSFIVTLFITVISYFVTDRELMRKIKEKQKALREEMKKYRDNPEKMVEINKKMMEDFPYQMKQSLKIMVITMIPLLIFFKWARDIFSQTPIASTWIWWYIGASLVFSIFLRKIFKLD